MDRSIAAELHRYKLITQVCKRVKTIVPKIKSKSNIVVARYLFVQIGAAKNTHDPVFPSDADDTCLPQILGDVIASNKGEHDSIDVNTETDEFLQTSCKELALKTQFETCISEMQQMENQFKQAIFNVHIEQKTEFGNYIYVTNTDNQLQGPRIFVYQTLLDKLSKSCVHTELVTQQKSVYLVLLRYLQVLDSGMHQLALFYKDVFHEPNITECFASPLNRTCERFCGAFPDVDSMFKGYLGRFEDLIFHAGQVYTVNPPYDAKVMEKSSERIVQVMSTVKNIKIYVTIPIWDYEGLLAAYPPTSHHLFEKYKNQPYPALDALKKSPFVHKITIYKREELPYYDHVNLKTKYPCASYIVELLN
jgi:hypothetical protein